jgi:diguanylate cyclase (GGDEF)-like protein
MAGQATGAAQTVSQLVEIWRQYRPATIQRLVSIEAAVAAIVTDTLNDQLRAGAHADAHKLAGSLGTFGLHRASDIARVLEFLFEVRTNFSREETLRLCNLTTELRARIEQGPTDEHTRVEPSDVPLLLIVDVDANVTESLSVEAAGQGFRTKQAATLTAAHATIANDRPDLVIVNVSSTYADGNALEFIETVTCRNPEIVVVALGNRDGFMDRVDVARHGARGFIAEPISHAQAIATTADVFRRTKPRPTRLLAVDDDAQLLEAVRVLLRPINVEVTGLTDPVKFWEVLNEIRPEVVLFDVAMPEVNGIELCRVVRGDARWKHLPILFLTEHTDGFVVQQIFEAGADDYMSKPIVAPELVTRVRNRLERTMLTQKMSDTDAVTGLMTRRKVFDALGDAIHVASERNDPLAVALIRLDRFTPMREQYSPLQMDEVLHTAGDILTSFFRSEDSVGRWSDGEFLAVMNGLTRAQGVHRLGDLLERVREQRFSPAGADAIGLSFSCGVAEFSKDGVDAEQLYRAAGAAMEYAAETGGNRVVGAGASNPRSKREAVDVVLVDDDEALSKLIEHALQTRGYRTRWFPDATSFLSVVEPAEGLSMKLLLLDVEMPGMDGYALLRKLAQEEVVKRTRVIMLTIRSAEAEVMKAMELGAFDHIAKPFSMPVLMQRIRRAIEA